MYEINIAKLSKEGHGRWFHFFATHERSLMDREKAEEVFEALEKAFPAPEYQITLERKYQTGEEIRYSSNHPDYKHGVFQFPGKQRWLTWFKGRQVGDWSTEQAAQTCFAKWVAEERI